jgi:hypothetical protein
VRLGGRFAAQRAEHKRGTVVIVCGYAAAVVLVLAGARGLIPGDVATVLGVTVGTITSLLLLFTEETAAATERVLDRLARDVYRHESLERGFLLGDSAHAVEVGLKADAVPSAPANLSWSDALGYFLSLNPARLVLTGQPGAGKTTLTAELALAWLTAREEGDTDRLPSRWARRVPVRASLSSWRDGVPLEEWLVDQLVEGYGVPRAPARDLVRDRRIVPLLDGLDELDAEGVTAGRAGRVLAALNGYRAGTEDGPLVITCREARYQQLLDTSCRLQHAVQLRIQPVTAEQAIDFLRRRDVDPDRWEPVVRVLTKLPTCALARALSSPWRLTLIVSLYEADRGRNPAELVRMDSDQLSRHLLSHYVTSVTGLKNSSRRRGYRPGPRRVERWLAMLAAYLNGHAGLTLGGQTVSDSDVMLHQLWPIAGQRAPRWVDALIGGVLGSGLFLLFFEASALRIDWGWVAIGSLAGAAGLAWWPSPNLIAGRLLGRRTGSAGSAGRFTLAVLGVAAYTLEWLIILTLAALGAVIAPILYLLLPLVLVAGGLFWLTKLLDPSLVNVQAFMLLPLCAFLVYLGALRLVLRAQITQRLVLRFHEATEAMHDWFGSFVAGEPGLGVRFARVDGETSPRSPIVSDLASWLACLLLAGVTVALGFEFGFLGRHSSLALRVPTVAFVVMLGVLGVFRFGRASRRYLAMLLCSRRRLPWRLIRFLDWACDAGLLRTSGLAYQFRHLELRDWLASENHQVHPDARVDAPPAIATR